MKVLLQRAWGSQFLRHNFVLFVGSAAVGALNYLYYPVVGRLLDPSAFGEVQALVSLFLQICIFLAVAELVIVNIVANYHDEQKRNAVILEFQKVGFYFSGFLLLMALVFGRQLQEFFHFASPLPFVLLGLALVANVPFTFEGAYLQGHKRFGTFSAGNILAATTKLVTSAVLIVWGLGTIGAMAGLVTSQVLGSVFVVWWALRLGLRRDSSRKRSAKLNVRLLAPELKFGGIVLLGSLLMTLQYSMDTLVVKHYFDAHTAGLYAGVASVARIVFFVTASITQVLMPSVQLDGGERRNRQLLLRSLGLMMCVGVPLLGLFVLAPRFVMNLLMGGKFTGAADVLPLLSFTIFTVSILNLFISYSLALRRYAVAVFVSLGALLTYVLMVLNHASLEAVVANMLIGSVAMITALAFWLVVMPKSNKEGVVWQGN